MSEKGSSGSVILADSTGIKPKGLIDAISEIEWYYTAESEGSPIAERFFTMKNKIEFFEVGFKGAFISGLLSAFFTPFAIGVVEKFIPIFGTLEPSAFDKAFVFMLALGFSLGYAVLIGQVGRFYGGNFTKSMIKSFLSGVIAGAVLKMVVAFLFFHFLYLTIITEKNIISVLQPMRDFVSYETLNNIYIWILNFKPVFLTSAWFVVFTTIIFIMIPLIMITITVIKQKRKELSKIA